MTDATKGDVFRHGELIAVMSKDQNSRHPNGRLVSPTKFYVYAIGEFEDGVETFFELSFGAAEVLASEQAQRVIDQVKWVRINLADNPSAVHQHRNWQVFFQLPDLHRAQMTALAT